LSVSSDGHHIVFGCENGWIYLFDRNGLVWSKRLIGTYYRGPFNDVSVTSVDVYKGYVAVGTDFVDGKVYLFDLDGKELWRRQLLSILGCWERPDDVKFVRISSGGLAVVSGFMNDKVTILNFDGDEIFRENFGDFVNCMDFDSILAVGQKDRSAILYPRKKEFKFFEPMGVLVVDDWAVFFNESGLFCTLGWKIDAKNPRVSANSDYVAFSSLNRVHVCNLNGKILKTFTLNSYVVDLKLVDDCPISATSDGIYINDEKIYEGRAFRICDHGVLVGDERNLRYVELW